MAIGGQRIDGPAYFYPTTVLTGVPAGARILREEIFRPVAPITVFDTPRTKRSAWPAKPNSALSARPSPPISTAGCASRSSSRPACSS